MADEMWGQETLEDEGRARTVAGNAIGRLAPTVRYLGIGAEGIGVL
jgi:hypothetical protein